MRRWFICLAVFSGFFMIARYQSRVQRQSDPVAVTATPVQTSTPAPSSPSPAKSVSALHGSGAAPVTASPVTVAEPVRLDDTDPARLYRGLFDDGSFRSRALTAADLQIIERRFAANLPAATGKHLSADTRELIGRIGLLKALEGKPLAAPSADLRGSLAGFYLKILEQPRGNFMVKRQALRNIASLQRSRTGREKTDLLRRLDSRVISAAALSDRELIEAELAH